MCGFFGFMRYQAGAAVDTATLEQAGQALRLRGPDEQTVYQDDYLSLVFRRLSIVDLKGGSQPIWNKAKDCFVVVNGEIYNHQQLREQLPKDCVFQTQSDAEIVLHLYHLHGERCFAMLNGMFSIVLWDKKQQRALFARDRLGIKPLYYAALKDGVLFASELKALLLHPDCPSALNWDDLTSPGPQQTSPIASYVQGINHFPAGHYSQVDKQTKAFTSEPYWSLDTFFSAPVSTTAEELTKGYQALLYDAVEKRLMSDVPVGLFLSGGIDSSLLAAMVAKKNKNVHCFCFVERTTYQSGDVALAKQVADSLELPFHPIYFDTDKMAADFNLQRLENLVCLIESPRFDPEWYFKSELHRAAKAIVPELKVMLLGQGADEFCGGYSRYMGSKWQTWQEYLDNNVIPSLSDNRHPLRFINAMNNDKADGEPSPYQQKMTQFSYQLQHFNLWHEDRSSAYHGVESRVPYLDHRLVELLVSVPEDLQTTLFWNKQILRDASKKYLPNYPQSHPKVPFFVTQDISSIDEFIISACKNCFSAFETLYIDSGRCPFSKSALYQLMDELEKNQATSAWQLMECMCISIFAQFCLKPKAYLDNSFFVESEPLKEILSDDWPAMEELLSQPIVKEQIWQLDTKINIAADHQILNPLTEQEGITELVLVYHGQERGRLKLSDEVDWLVSLLDEMGRYQAQPQAIKFWSEKTKQSPELLASMMGELVKSGFVVQV